MSRRRRFVPATLAIALATACGLALFACSRAENTAEAEATAPAAAPTPQPVSVTVQPVVEQRVERTVDFVGTLNAYSEAAVATEVDGRLTAIEADLGDSVSKGQTLATLDSAELEAKLREAEATLVRRTNDEKRAQQLKAQGVMSQQEFDGITSDLGVARARRDVLAIEVEHTKIQAPFDGRIAKRMADIGNFVRTGTPLFVLVADNPLRLRGEVPERFASEIATGQEVRGYVEAFPDDAVVGKLTRISPAANPQSRAITVEAIVPNAGGKLKTGFFCKAQILTKLDAQAVVVPVESLVSFAGVTRVFVIDKDGTAHGREVQTGLRLGTVVEITGGLHAGEQVAISGLARLTDGTRVSVREGPPAAAGSEVGARSTGNAQVGAEDTGGPAGHEPEPARPADGARS